MSAASEAISAGEAADLFGILSQSPVLLLAVSGGPDSTALMWLAARWRDGLEHPPKLIAVTVDHGLRKESAYEALAVKRLAKALKVEHHTLRWIGKKPKAGLMQAARNARYRLLAGLARKAGAEQILLGHTLDDQAETVLMRLARGSGVSGLAGMRPYAPVPAPVSERTSLVRPLLGVSKARLIATLRTAKVPYADDPTNRDTDFTRPRLRTSMMALAREGLTAERLALLAERVSRVEIALYEVLNETLMRLAPGPWPDKGPVAVDAGEFMSLSDEIALRLLGRIIHWSGNDGAVELGKLEALYAALEGPICDTLKAPETPGRFRRTLAGALVTVTKGKLSVERAPPRRSAAKTGNRKRKAAFTKPR